MRIPLDAILPAEKLTKYLLASRLWDDKSKFLAQAGFVKDEPDVLEKAIRQMVTRDDAIEDGSNTYGKFYRVEGSLEGPSGQALQVIQIWLEWNLDGSIHFVTLKPKR